jgi:hypothetical protein
MAAITVTWDPTVPPGSEALSNGDNRIVELKTGMVERLRNGGHGWDTTGSGTTNQEDGRHTCGIAFTQGDPSALAGEFYFYDRDGSTVIMTLRDATAATPSELFLGAFKLRTTGNVSAATGTFTGAVTIGGTLGITGVTTVSDIVKPNADTTVDLGVNTTNRWRDLWIGRNAAIVGTLTVTGAVTFNGAVTHNANETFIAGLTVQGSANAFNVTTQQRSTVLVIDGPGTTAASFTDRIVMGILTANCNYTLPTAASSPNRELWIGVVNADTTARTITVDRASSDTISDGIGAGVNSVTLGAIGAVNRINSMHLVSDGVSKWYIMEVRYSDEGV